MHSPALRPATLLNHPTAWRLASVAAVLLALPGLSGCVAINAGLSRFTHKPWRMDAPMVPVTEKVKDKRGIVLKDAAGNAIEKEVAQMGIVEFDDQGQLWRDNYKKRDATAPGKSELGRVLEALKQRVEKGPVQLVIFVHGWNNNASDLEQGNVNSFREMLKTVAKAHPNPFGVMISWRGMTMKFPTMIDIYNREASAKKIGQAEATAAIQALCSTAKHGQDDSRVLAVGHSLGAVILLRAVAQPLAAQIAQASVDTSGTVKVRPMADTVVLVNAADTAGLASQMVQVMQDYHAKYKRNGRDAPLLVSLTSTGDWATGWLYSGVSRLSRYVLGTLMTSSAGASANRIQEHGTVTSVGWHTAIHSHDLVPTQGTKPVVVPPVSETGRVLTESERAVRRIEYLMSENFKPSKPGEKNLTVWLDPTLHHREISSGPLQAYNLKYKDDQNNNTPYWIFQVPPFVVRDHNDIWNSNFVGLVTAIHNASREPREAGPSSSSKSTRPAQSMGLTPLPPIKQGVLSASPLR